MLVYRFENIDGLGPYWGSGYSKIHDEFWTDHIWHPRFDLEDIKTNPLLKQDYFVYGFPSLEMVLRWFDYKSRIILQNLEYSLKLYDIDKSGVIIAPYQRQLVFYKPWSTLLKTIKEFDYGNAKEFVCS